MLESLQKLEYLHEPQICGKHEKKDKSTIDEINTYLYQVLVKNMETAREMHAWT